MKTIYKLYVYLPVVALILGVFYVFGAEDVYRYPCQDPANWENAECSPPACDATGACTKDLIANGDDIMTQLEKLKQLDTILSASTDTSTEGTPQ